MKRLKYYLTGGPAFGRSFRLFAQLNYDTTIVYAHHLGGRVREITLSHAEYDGINGFTQMLDSTGSLTESSFPAVPPRKRVFPLWRIVNRFLQYFRVLWQFSRPSREWKKGDATPKTIFSVWHFFTAEETRKLREEARKQSISLNSHLFASLNRAVEPYLEPSPLPATWIVPVSLYREFSEARKPGIRTSIMEIGVQSGDSAEVIHEKIRREVERESFWGTIVGVLINDWLPDSLNRKILAATVARKKRVGTFSNIGKWVGKESSPDEAWGIVAPVHPGQPLGCAAVEYNGKLGLGMKVDPCLGIGTAKAEALIRSWARMAEGN